MADAHNGPEHLTVSYLWRPRSGGVVRRKPGWYVIRQCHCHYGLPVTVSFKSQAQAERVRELLLAASKALGT